MNAATESSPPELITQQDEFASLCARWRHMGRFAFDTEFIRDDTFHATLCLVQVVDEEAVALIDPLAGLDLTPFWALVCDPKVTTVVHAGKEDFEICLKSSGKPPRGVFDVQVAAGLVGYGHPLSLAKLVDVVCHKRLSKGATMTDWQRRPLTDDQLRYACDDVAYLLPIHAKLAQELDKRGRMDWALEEMARFEDPDLYRPPAEDRLFKLKGAKKLDGLSLAVLAELIAWRDDWAQERNRPIRALMRDDVLVEIARRRPQKASQLEVLRGFPQSRNHKVIQTLLDTIAAASETPPEKRPKPHVQREETPMMRSVTDVLSAVLRAICYEEGVSQDLVGGAQRLRELVDYTMGREQRKPTLLTGWRGVFVGRQLVRLLEGGGEVHLSGWPKSPRLELIEHNHEPKPEAKPKPRKPKTAKKKD